jgi:hypothetical protein
MVLLPRKRTGGKPCPTEVSEAIALCTALCCTDVYLRFASAPCSRSAGEGTRLSSPTRQVSRYKTQLLQLQIRRRAGAASSTPTITASTSCRSLNRIRFRLQSRLPSNPPTLRLAWRAVATALFTGDDPACRLHLLPFPGRRAYSGTLQNPQNLPAIILCI